MLKRSFTCDCKHTTAKPKIIKVNNDFIEFLLNKEVDELCKKLFHVYGLIKKLRKL